MMRLNKNQESFQTQTRVSEKYTRQTNNNNNYYYYKPINMRTKITTQLMVISMTLIITMLSSIKVDAHSLAGDSSHSGEHNNQLNLVGSGRIQNGNKLQTNDANSANRCQSGWMWFNNKCWVTTQSRRDFLHAVELCKKMYNSTLPTIHSEDENEFLRQNIDLTNSPIWLYARHNHQYNKTRWLDKSPVNYTRWDSGQPSDKSSLVCIKTEESWYMKKAEPVDGQTECVTFWEDAKWGTQVGCLVLLPVVCEKKLIPISRTYDGPNGSLSNYEQQQMYPISSGSSTIRSPMEFVKSSISSYLSLLIAALLVSSMRSI